jgi:hypothetical protein
LGGLVNFSSGASKLKLSETPKFRRKKIKRLKIVLYIFNEQRMVLCGTLTPTMTLNTTLNDVVKIRKRDDTAL